MMKRLSGLRRVFWVAPVLAALVIGVRAQAAPAADPLFDTIKAQDTALFGAVNTCDLKTLSAMVADDLEFYHDITGLAVGKQVFLDSVKNNLCGKVTRELVAGTLEIGVHRFHHPGQDDNVGEAKFIHLWQYKDGVWKLTRVISYEHGAAK
jgi:hypothetical protein